jgi:repressor of nif and glnA expression
MDFDLEKKSGRVIMNLSLIHKADFSKALKIMIAVFTGKLATGDRVMMVEAGEQIGGITIPTGKVGFGTLCSLNLNGILLKHAIPVESKMGGLLQIDGGEARRFTAIINYSGSTLDPHEVFIKSRMTSVREAAEGAGKVLAGLREIPAASVHEAEALIRKTEAAGIGRVIMLGKPGQTVLGMPVQVERVGIVVPGGLNPIAAVEEWGIETESKALVAMVEYEKLISFWDL